MLYTPEHCTADLKSNCADMKNYVVGSNEGSPALTAALFIRAHIDDAQDWTHVDIAAPSFYKERSTAHGVALLCALLADKLDANVAK